MMGALALVGAVGIGEGRAVGGVCGVGTGLYECIGFWVLSRLPLVVDATDDIGPKLGV